MSDSLASLSLVSFWLFLLALLCFGPLAVGRRMGGEGRRVREERNERNGIGEGGDLPRSISDCLGSSGLGRNGTAGTAFPRPSALSLVLCSGPELAAAFVTFGASVLLSLLMAARAARTLLPELLEPDESALEAACKALTPYGTGVGDRGSALQSARKPLPRASCWSPSHAR